MLLNDIFQVTLGVSACGAVAALAFRLLRIMTSHGILLTGQSLGDTACGLPEAKAADSAYTKRFRYCLRLQSLEAARTEYPMEVTIRGFPNGRIAPTGEDHVWCMAGWKAIDVLQTIGCLASREEPCCKP